MKVGVDFDNTLIDYDALFFDVALRRGLIKDLSLTSKKSIRDAIRLLADGEIEWQRVQGVVYGPRIMEARLMEGVADFFYFCKTENIKVFIISHKTEYAAYDKTRTNLRKSAMGWMTENGFFDERISPLSSLDVFFESARTEKISRIKQLGCTHFLDDLEETFWEKSFPDDITKILYNPHMEKTSLRNVKVVSSWQEILSLLGS
jgi:hypothetical protein